MGPGSEHSSEAGPRGQSIVVVCDCLGGTESNELSGLAPWRTVPSNAGLPFGRFLNVPTPLMMETL